MQVHPKKRRKEEEEEEEEEKGRRLGVRQRSALPSIPPSLATDGQTRRVSSCSMNFSRYPNARADIFRTCSKSVLDPPGPFLPSKLVLQSLPGSKAGETIKAFSLNGSIDEDLKAAADRLKRQRKPVAQTLGANSVGGGRLKAAKGKGKRAKAKTATTQKLSTDADSIVEVAADAAHAQAYPQSPSEALEGGRKKRHRGAK